MQYLSIALAGLLPLVSANVLRRTDQCYALKGTTCSNLVIGQKDTGKQICTSVSGSNLIVNYPAVSGYAYSEVHVYLGSKPPASSAPGQFPYTSGNGYCTVAAGGSTATCTIPIADFGTCGGSYYIATHSAQGTETGWGKGSCIEKSCKPWAMYWGPITIDCPPCTSSTTTPTTTTPAPSSPSTTKVSTTTDKPPTTTPVTTTGTTTKPSTTTSVITTATPTPSYPACWTTCWKKYGVSSKDQACQSPDSTKCVDDTCSAGDSTSYHSWLGKDCPAQITTTPSTPVSPTTTTSFCESKSAPAPVITSSACPKVTSSVEHSTYEETEYTTTVLTNTVTKTSDVTQTYTITSTCSTTSTPAPVVYTTTCAAK